MGVKIWWKQIKNLKKAAMKTISNLKEIKHNRVIKHSVKNKVPNLDRMVNEDLIENVAFQLKGQSWRWEKETIHTYKGRTLDKEKQYLQARTLSTSERENSTWKWKGARKGLLGGNNSGAIDRDPVIKVIWLW